MELDLEITNLILKALRFVSDDDYDKARDIIQSILNNKSYLEKLNCDHWQYIADMSLAMGNFDLAKTAYIKAENNSGLAFTLIFVSDLEGAKRVLANEKPSPASNWCNFLIEIFSGNDIKKLPLFFTIQHFLEFTVYHLLLAQNQTFLNILVRNLDNFLKVNLDSEKMIGKAYFHLGKLDEARQFFNAALRRNPEDGEISFFLGRLCFQKNQFKEALSFLYNGLVFMPEHYPTTVLIEKIEALLL